LFVYYIIRDAGKEDCARQNWLDWIRSSQPT